MTKSNTNGVTPRGQAQAGHLPKPVLPRARVTAVDRGAYLVRNETRELPAELSGRFKFRATSPTDFPCVGDWVSVQYHSHDLAARIHETLPRKSFLRRKSAGVEVDYQMIAANLDGAFIVQSCHVDFNVRRLDRFLIMAADGGVEPIVILTKTDLITPAALAQQLAALQSSHLNVKVLALSNVTGRGFDEFQQLLQPGRTYCLLGSSGVGKTTLVNRLLGEEAYDTQTVSETGEGIHTTSRRQLVILPQGAMLIDTPGIREIGLLDVDEGVEHNFPEIVALAQGCRYPDCSHTQEPGCAVRAAVTSAALTEERYASYLKLRQESTQHGRAYQNKRRQTRKGL